MADVKVYGASWCPDCRRAKKFLSEQRIAFEWHDLENEPDLISVVQSRNNGNNVIPTIVFADDSHLSEPSNEELADKLGIVRAASQHIYDLVIVGGGPTGLTTSIYAARENLDTLVVDRSGLGGQAGVTERLDNYPGFPEGIGGAELADRFVAQARRYGVEMLQAVGVDAVAQRDGHMVIDASTGDHYHGRAALIATGSSYRRTGAPGEDDLIGAGIHFCATCDGPFYKGSSELVVIGGGNSGLEEGLFLTQFTSLVTVIERTGMLRGSRLLQEKVGEHPKMRVLVNHGVKEFKAREGGKLRAVVVEDLETGTVREHEAAGAFVFIGLDPNAGFVKDSVELDARGFIVTDAAFSTSMPGVFAAGDVRAGSTKQLASAVGEGAAAAIAIRGYLDRLS